MPRTIDDDAPRRHRRWIVLPSAEGVARLSQINRFDLRAKVDIQDVALLIAIDHKYQLILVRSERTRDVDIATRHDVVGGEAIRPAREAVAIDDGVKWHDSLARNVEIKMFYVFIFGRVIDAGHTCGADCGQCR